MINKYARQYLNFNDYTYLKLPIFKSVIYTSSEGYTFQSRDISFEFDDIPALANRESSYFEKSKKFFLFRFFIFLYNRPFILLIALVFVIIFLIYLFLFNPWIKTIKKFNKFDYNNYYYYHFITFYYTKYCFI